jgi:6,7-dimethyl-8-ribityllumazine synthase
VIQRIESSADGAQRRVAIVQSRFNPEIGQGLLRGALRALKEANVGDDRITVVTVPGALEAPLALQRLAQSGDFDALVALGAVIRGETYHFEIVANESAAGLASVQLEFGIPIGYGILS